MEFEIRPIEEHEFARYVRVVGAAFAERASDDETERFRAGFERARSLAVFSAGQMVATAATMSLELTLPGGVPLAVGGVTTVGVLPTHRRRGILRQMMRRQLGDIRAHGEAIAVLTASESNIYGRFGYGIAASTFNLAIERQYARLAYAPAYDGTVEFIEHDEALDVFPAFYERLRRQRPGMVSRSGRWWADFLHGPEAGDGLGPRFYVVCRATQGEVEGIAQYRKRLQLVDRVNTSVLVLRDLLGASPAATAALWHMLFGVDLVQTIQMERRPVDEPLRWMLAEPRRLRVTALTDDLWLRLLDIPRALASRRYAASGQIVLAVDDPFVPENAGCYALEGGPDGATCQMTQQAAELALDVADLGAAYLGGVRFSTLAQAGRVRERVPGALARADALFASDPIPWCGTPF